MNSTILRRGDDLRPAHELRDLASRGEVSAVEILEAGLAEVERRNAELNAVVTLNPRALDEAAALDARRKAGEPLGALHGLLVVIKDVTETAGLRTTYGSPTYQDFVPEKDALVVSRLKAAGAVVVGKSNTPEMALGAHTVNPVFGATRHPARPELSPGGSTGGGAVALATGMAALAEGTDLGGSLRIPASFCGLCGLRPSVGLVPTWPTIHPWDTLYVTGPMARSIPDLALFLDACAGSDPRAPLSWDPGISSYFEAVTESPGRAERVAFLADPTKIGIDSEIVEVCRRSALQLRDRGVEVEELELDVSWARDTFRRSRGLWALEWHQQRLPDEAGQGGDARLGENVRANLDTGLSYSVREVAAASQERAELCRIFGELLRDYDGLLTPTVAVKPFSLVEGQPRRVAGQSMETYIDWVAPTSVLSLTGLPVLSVPAGVDAQGLPVGLQVVGRPRSEVEILRLGQSFESSP